MRHPIQTLVSSPFLLLVNQLFFPIQREIHFWLIPFEDKRRIENVVNLLEATPRPDI